MLTLHLDLTMDCDNRCVFCNCGKAPAADRAYMELAVARREIEDARAAGARALGFFGGEPSVHPGLFDIVRFARDAGYEKVFVETNGASWSDPERVRRALDAGVTGWAVSIHSPRAAVDDALTGVPGNLARKLSGLRGLLDERARGAWPDGVGLRPVVLGPTLGALRAYAEHFRGTGIDRIEFAYVWPQHLALGDRDLVRPYREAAGPIARLLLWNERSGRMDLCFTGVPPCVLAWSDPPLSARLAGFLAEKYLLDRGGELRVAGPGGQRFSWREWRSALKTKPERCGRCRYREGCDGAWRTYADLYGLDELQPQGAA